MCFYTTCYEDLYSIRVSPPIKLVAIHSGKRPTSAQQSAETHLHAIHRPSFRFPLKISTYRLLKGQAAYPHTSREIRRGARRIRSPKALQLPSNANIVFIGPSKILILGHDTKEVGGSSESFSEGEKEICNKTWGNRSESFPPRDSNLNFWRSFAGPKNYLWVREGYAAWEESLPCTCSSCRS